MKVNAERSGVNVPSKQEVPNNNKHCAYTDAGFSRAIRKLHSAHVGVAGGVVALSSCLGSPVQFLSANCPPPPQTECAKYRIGLERLEAQRCLSDLVKEFLGRL